MFQNVKIRICKNIIFPMVLHDCQTWTLTLKEEHRLRVFENIVPIFELKRVAVTGG
jgi:hypothetical protein